MPLTKYIHCTTQKGWEKQLLKLETTHNIKTTKEYDKQDKVLTHYYKGRIVAVWDFMDLDGWVMTDTFFASNGELHKLYDEL